MPTLAIDKMGAADPVWMSADDPGAETTLMGGMVCVTEDVGAFAIFTEEPMGHFETTDGCAKISYFKAYGVSSVCCDLE